MNYITCLKRKNHPRIYFKVCEEKCKHVKSCQEYLSYINKQHPEQKYPDSDYQQPEYKRNVAF
jgi:hypothetical protein